MEKVLISFFSASGKTKSVAEKIAKLVNEDLFEIKPVKEYTKEDLDWTDKQSRSSIEMEDKSSRPEIAKKINEINQYDKVLIGFPIWWYTAPTIINTFIEENDLTKKSIYLFVTSGSSSETKSLEDLKKQYPDLNFISAKRFTGNESEEEIEKWLM